MLRASMLLLLVTAASAPPPAKSRLPTPRIIDGYTVGISWHPYQLSMQDLGRHVCGASIISLTYALSSAHCISTTFVKHMSVRAGSSNRESGGTLYDADYACYNGDYTPLTTDYDIGIIKIAGNFSFGTNVKAVGLATLKPADGKVVFITGWGTMHYESSYLTPELHAALTFIVNRTYCKERYAPLEITERMICVGEEQKHRDACLGDGGGPLVADNTQYGIVSWGHGCGEPGYPGVYSSVAALRDWIRKSTGV